jgi:DNA-binding GntR family transcriptional regulator
MATTPTILNSRSLSEEIVEILQRSILMGEYKPGEPLVERDLASQFGVSSIPVREALQVLESRGLVRKRRNRSCSVVELTTDELNQIVELRRVLETELVSWACQRMSPADVGELEAQVRELRSAAEQNDVARFFYEDLRFHQALWLKSGNRYAAEALNRAVGSLFAFGLMRAQGEAPPDLKNEVAKHEKLVDALRRQDASNAVAVLKNIAGDFHSQIQSQRKA